LANRKTQRNSSQKLRIIGGQWRSRQISFESAPGLRPTGDRIRETLFNWLAPSISGAHCLDLFAGSGALSFEALSRGAAHCTALELNPIALAQLNQNKTLLKAQNLEIVSGDCHRFLGQDSGEQHYHIVFIDPPFEAGLHNEICANLNNSGLLAANAQIYCEVPLVDRSFVPPKNWRQLQEKIAGEVKYCLYSFIEPAV
jgi:16S rRNA (guanine966-N2)-methyltransferase